MTAVQRALRVVASHGLPGAGIAAPPTPFDDESWRQLLSASRRQRIEGLLARAVADGVVPVTGAQRVDVESEETAAAVRSVSLERSLLRAVEVLADAGIEVRVLKGTAVGHLDYPDPVLRDFGDVDLLVTSEDYDATVEVLVSRGGQRVYEEIRRGYDRRFGKGTPVVDETGVELDIHRTFVAGPYAFTMDLPALFRSNETFELGGTTVAALGRDERFLHACYHGALGNVLPRLASLRDIAQMARHPALDTARVLGLAAAWAAEAVVARAVVLAWDTFELAETTHVSAWAAGFAPSAADQRAISSYLAVDSQFARQAIAAVRVIPGVVDRAAYIRALVLPDRAHRRSRDEHPLRRLLRGLRVAGERARS